jgi:hypothetical protein
MRYNHDGFVKSPISALSLILRHGGAPKVRQAEHRSSGLSPKAPVPLALILDYLLCHPNFDFLQVHQSDPDGKEIKS